MGEQDSQNGNDKIKSGAFSVFKATESDRIAEEVRPEGQFAGSIESEGSVKVSVDSDVKIKGTAANWKNASDRGARLVADIVRSLIAGHVEHELRPSAQLLLTELNSTLSVRELEVLKQNLLLARSHHPGQNIQGIITALLKQCFDSFDSSAPESRKFSAANLLELGEASASISSNSQARLLVILRDYALELAAFLDRYESDGIAGLTDLLQDCKVRFKKRASQMRLNEAQIQSANLFLFQVATAIFFNKLEMLTQDYLASGTDYSMVSGKVWASRYSRSDFMPFLFDPIDTLTKENSWLFQDSATLAKIMSLRVQVKAASLKADRIIDPRAVGQKKSLESIFLELRAIFGIGLNCLLRREGELALKLFERVLTCSADALESSEPLTAALSQAISRIRVDAYFCCIEAEIVDSGTRLLKAAEKDRIRIKESIFEKKQATIRSLLSKAKYELELLGLSGLPVFIDGNSHSSLEGLSEWVQKIIEQEESILLAELSHALAKSEQSHRYFCNYLAHLLGFESNKGHLFSELLGTIKVELKTGAQSKRIFGTRLLPSYSKEFTAEIIKRIAVLSPSEKERFITTFPLLLEKALEFQDFDLGFGLAIAHRHLFSEILNSVTSSPEFELLFGLVDSEVRYRFSLYYGESKSAQKSALLVLSTFRQKEKIGFLRSIDRKREDKLARAVDSFKKTEALRDLCDYRELQIISEGIKGQFVSQEIRMLNNIARASGTKKFAKELCALVIMRVDQRLNISREEISEFIAAGQSVDITDPNTNSERFLTRLNIESRAMAGVQMLLDASLTCAQLSDERSSRVLLKEVLNRYSQILPGLSQLVGGVLASKSLEAFRRRTESAISLLENEAVSEGLSIAGTGSGATIGFNISKNIPESLSSLFNNFAVVASISRRRIVAGRCKPIQRYSVAYSWGRMQRRVVSCIVAMHDGLGT